MMYTYPRPRKMVMRISQTVCKYDVLARQGVSTLLRHLGLVAKAAPRRRVKDAHLGRNLN
eukprot:723514-Amorphochlora_amoeboformis.AAC.1